jgi:hypothetical protein
VPTVLKSGNLNLLEPSGPVKACNGNAFTLNMISKGGQITYASETKFFGVWLNRNLYWDLHTENLLKKLSKLCFDIKTLRSSVSKNVPRTRYFA